MGAQWTSQQIVAVCVKLSVQLYLGLTLNQIWARIRADLLLSSDR